MSLPKRTTSFQFRLQCELRALLLILEILETPLLYLKTNLIKLCFIDHLHVFQDYRSIAYSSVFWDQTPTLEVEE